MTDVGLVALASISRLQNMTILHLAGLTPNGLAAALLACRALAKVKLHASFRPVLPQSILGYMVAHGCVFHWRDKAFQVCFYSHLKGNHDFSGTWTSLRGNVVCFVNLYIDNHASHVLSLDSWQIFSMIGGVMLCFPSFLILTHAVLLYNYVSIFHNAYFQNLGLAKFDL